MSLFDEVKRDGSKRMPPPRWNYPTQIVWVHSGTISREELTKILTSNPEEELYKKIVPMVADSPHLIGYALSHVEWAELIKRLREENNMMHEGWENYETWATSLWLENNEWTYKTVLSLKRGTKNRWEYADRIRKFTETLLENDLKGLAADLFSHAVSQINWDEIAEQWIENYFPEQEEEEYNPTE